MRWLLSLLLLGCATAQGDGASPPDSGACESACPAAARRCSPVGSVQVCADSDGDGCNEWGGDAECPDGAVCKDGACVSGCQHACAPGDVLCSINGPRACGDEDGDGCRELLDPVPCAPDERCDEGACVPRDQACADACAGDGERACTPDGYQRCGQFDEDPCLEWSVTIACAPGASCFEGECIPDCNDECAPGERRCEGNAFVTCGQNDDDACLEAGAPIVCREDERCDNGDCVPADAPCEDDCDADGVLSCDGEGAFRRCGQYDADPCLEHSAPVPCAGFQICRAGACVASCEDDCQAGERRCIEGGSQLCGNYDRDPCLEWSPADPCRDDERCDDGRCVPDEQACEDTCAADAVECAAGGVRTCGDHDEDPCLEWGVAVPCDDGERCEAGECVYDCEDECEWRTSVCVAPGIAACGEFDADPCFELGEPAACPDGQSCSDGACRVDCVDDCAAGATDCALGGLRRCGDFDGDPCRDWSSPTPCGADAECRDGACVQRCEDECAADERRCLGEGFEICGDFDEDPCTEFGGGASCDAGEACVDGACAVECADECAEGASRCADDAHVETCGNFDGDRCREWGVPQACDAHEACLAQRCEPRPAPRGVVINEVLFDVDGVDPPGVFIELAGPAGTDLGGLEIVGVNGATGEDYAVIPLEGAIPGDGLYVVAHPSAVDAVRAVADLLHASADFQNGPDSVQLRAGEEAVDALAYGVGARHEFGEGQPAAIGLAGESLSRDEAHTDTNDNGTDFAAGPPSPGAVAPCDHQCELDAVRCDADGDADAVQRCARRDDGCLTWAAVEECAGRCLDGACVDGCAVPDALGAPTPLPGLAANVASIAAVPLANGGWAVATGDAQAGMHYGAIDANTAWITEPLQVGTTLFGGWGDNSVYYPSMVNDGAQLAITWSAFSDQGNRDIHFRRVTVAGELVARADPNISGGAKGFAPQLRLTAGGSFQVFYNRYTQLNRIDVSSLGVQSPVVPFGELHEDTREESFLAVAPTADGLLVAYVVGGDGGDRLFLQATDGAGAARGDRIDLGLASTDPRGRSVWLFPVAGARFVLLWRTVEQDAQRTDSVWFGVVDAAGVFERRIRLNELDRPQLYVPNLRPTSVLEDGGRFGVVAERWFDGQEARRSVVQWVTAEGVHVGLSELGDRGGVLVRHPDDGVYRLFTPGAPVTTSVLGCAE